MTTKENTVLSQYIAKGMPDELKEGAWPPADYYGEMQDWLDSQAAARRIWIEQATVVFHFKVQQGWTERELLSDEPMEVSGDGTPRRALPVTVPADLLRLAATAYMELRQRGLRIDDVLMYHLEMAQGRRYPGDVEHLTAAIQAAQAVVNSHHAEAKKAHLIESNRLEMVVHCSFLNPSTRIEYQRGTYYITQELAHFLVAWRDKMTESYRGRESGPGEAGYSQWPPFSISGIMPSPEVKVRDPWLGERVVS